MRDSRLPIVVALTAPICVVTALLASISAAESAGGTLRAGRAPQNLAEAAGAARADLVIRYLREGQDPARVYPVHPDVISSAVLHATALEAAMWSRQLELIELLDRQGAIPRGPARQALACLADDLGVDDVVEYLSADGAPDCVAERELKRVMARTIRPAD